MKTRVLSGLIMLPLLLILYFGGYVLFAACLLIGIMGVREFYNGFRQMDVKPSFGIAVVMAVALYVLNFIGVRYEGYMLWFFVTVLVSLLYLFNIENRKLEDAMSTIRDFLCGVLLFSCHSGGSGGSVQQYDMAYRAHCIRNRCNGVLHRFPSRQT